MILVMKIKKSYIKYISLFVAMSLLVFLLVVKIPHILIFIGLTLLTGIIVFVNYFLQVPVDFSPVFFLSIIITSTLGFGYTFLFVILAGLLPGIFSGDFKPSILVYFFANIFVNLISIPLNFSLLTEGIILSFLYGFLVTVTSGIIESDFGQGLFVNLVSFGINIFYFWKLGEILASVLQ